MKKLNLVIAILALTSASAGLIGCTNTHHQESTGQYIDSASITTKVKSKLLADTETRNLPISVTTYKNTVHLSGFVNSPYQKLRAIAIAKSVPGVEFVADYLVINTR